MSAADVKTFESQAEIEQAMQAFSAISGDLMSGFAALTARAEHVEAELYLANQQLEQKVRELDALRGHLEAILASLPTGVVVRDADGTITRINEAAEEILGIHSASAVGRTSVTGLAADESDRANRTVEMPDGRVRTLASRISAIHDPSQATTGSVEILDDRTQLTQMQQRVHQLDKMAALGTVAGGIAHEIRNPMNAVKGFAGLLAKDMPEGSKQAHWANLISEGVHEADTIIASVLSFSHPERLHIETLNTTQLIADALEAVERDMSAKGNSSAWQITTDVHPVSFAGDRIKLRQALRNMIANAIDAQPSGGRVHVEAFHANDEVVVRVSDAGQGFSPEAIDHITEPFFTTNASGTGLGLALVHTIIQLHAGHFEADKTPSALGGASVSFRVPTDPKN